MDLSVSRIQLYAWCPKAYQFRYHTKRDSPNLERSQALPFGNLVHKALEIAYQWAVTNEFVGFFSRSQIIDFCRQAFEQEGPADKNSFDETVDLVRQYLDRSPEVDHFLVLGIEKHFRFQLDHGDWLTGIIDRVDRVDKETLRIVDYKTNRIPYSDDELEGNLQMSVYHLAAARLWRWAKRIVCSFDMLRVGESVTLERTEQDLEQAEAYVQAVSRKIQDETEYAPRLNVYCGWCEYKHLCSAYRAALSEVYRPELVVDRDVEAVCRAREKAAALEKIGKQRRQELDRVIKLEIRKRQGRLRAAGHGYRITAVEGRRWESPYNVLMDLLAVTRTVPTKSDTTRIVPESTEARPVPTKQSVTRTVPSATEARTVPTEQAVTRTVPTEEMLVWANLIERICEIDDKKLSDYIGSINLPAIEKANLLARLREKATKYNKTPQFVTSTLLHEE